MGIRIINQTNEQECGVCALMALHNHFYKENIGKEQILNESHISDSGMTIFDLEVLGGKLGLECESYEVKFAEFLNLKINHYFILLVSTGDGSTNHYVVARKQKQHIEIYDSCSSEMTKLSYKQLEKIFLNVVILVKKQPNKAFTTIFGKATTLLMFDLKFVLLNLGLSVLILCCSIATASFLNFVIDLAISKSSIHNLITISFIFLFIYFANDILSYISNLYMSRHMKNYFVLFTNKILSSVEFKKLNFLNKVDKNWIFKIDECVFNVANFCIVEINKFITSVIFCITCICVIGSLQVYLLIFTFVYLLIEIIFFLFSYRKKKELFISIIRNENSNAQYYKRLITSLQQEVWHEKRKSLLDAIKSNYSNIYKNYYDTILFKNNSSLFKSLLKSFVEISIIVMMAVLIIKSNQLSIGKLTFVISAFALFKNSSEDLFGYFLSKIEFDVYWQVYKDLTTISNVDKTKQLQLTQTIKTVRFQSENEMIQLNINSLNQIKTSVAKLLKDAKNIWINEQVQLLNTDLMKQIIVIDQMTSPNTTLLLNDVEKDPTDYIQYLQYFNIDLNQNNQSYYQGLIINMLSLLHSQNKIIFIDDLLWLIHDKDKIVVNQIINKIKKYNYVFLLGKEAND